MDLIEVAPQPSGTQRGRDIQVKWRNAKGATRLWHFECKSKSEGVLPEKEFTDKLLQEVIAPHDIDAWCLALSDAEPSVGSDDLIASLGDKLGLGFSLCVLAPPGRHQVPLLLLPRPAPSPIRSRAVFDVQKGASTASPGVRGLAGGSLATAPIGSARGLASVDRAVGCRGGRRRRVGQRPTCAVWAAVSPGGRPSMLGRSQENPPRNVSAGPSKRSVQALNTTGLSVAEERVRPRFWSDWPTAL